jgi:hypothetical protein
MPCDHSWHGWDIEKRDGGSIRRVGPYLTRKERSIDSGKSKITGDSA